MRRGPAIAAVIGAVALAACGQPGAGNPASRPAGEPVAEQDYVSPPAVTSAVRLAAGRVLLVGTAKPASKVRLASPAGAAMWAIAGKDGAWRLFLPAASEVRLFGLSMTAAGRAVQAEGYLAVTPQGLAAQLRAGSGAVVLKSLGAEVAMLAADFDSKGGTVVSGVGPANTAVTLAVDGVERASARADGAGRFMLSLNEPLTPGSHLITAAGAGAREQEALTISPAVRPTGGPLNAAQVPGGWRLDWLTPGGGVQSTVLFDPPGAAP